MPLNEGFANNFSTTIAGSATGTTTGSKQVASTTGLSSGVVYRFLCESEIILGSLVDGTHINFLARGIEGTSAATHATSTTITQIVTAESLYLARGPRYDRSSFEDDFIFGLSSSDTGGKAGLNWYANGGSGLTWIDGEANHPGIARLSANNGTIVMNAHSGGNEGSFLPAATFDLTWIVRLGQSDANTAIQLGLRRDANATVATKPNDGIYLEKQGADTNWFFVTRASSVETGSRTDSGVATGTGWVVFRMRRIDGSTIGFTLGTGTEVTHTANIPTAALQPSVAFSSLTIVGKTADVDYVGGVITGISR